MLFTNVIFSAAMRQASTSPIAENGPYQSDAYLHPASSPVGTSTPLNKAAGNQQASYLTPLSRAGDEGYSKMTNGSVRQDTYLGQRFVKNKNSSPKMSGVKKNLNLYQVVPTSNQSPPKPRSRRLRSASCEDLSDYLRQVVYDPVSKSMNDLLDDKTHDDEGTYLGPEPFPRLYSMSVASTTEHPVKENYYNIEGLKGKIYDAPGLTVAEARKRFSKRSLSQIRRSVSNPNFIKSLDVERLNEARVELGIVSSHSSPTHSRSSSLLDILPDSLRRKLHKDSHHKGSHSALSTGSHNSSKASSRCSSGQPSPYNSLSRKNKPPPKEEIVAATSVKGINITRRSRSFRRQRTADNEKSFEEGDERDQQSNHKADNHVNLNIVKDGDSKSDASKGGNSNDASSLAQAQGETIEVHPGAKVSEEKVTRPNVKDTRPKEHVEMQLMNSRPNLYANEKIPPRVAAKPKPKPKLTPAV